jgi:DNA (cytosine-5)-methyltransferase 1
MRHGSLFSGIGGAELAASWMGWTNIFHCEKDAYCLKLLKQHYPESIEHTDVKTTEFIQYRGRINVLTAGFPCQPFSQSGKRKGKEDDRYLWPETIAAVKAIQPDWFVGENVLGILNWSKGMVFNQVQTDLEAAGYEVFTYVLPACGIDAPHRRDRVWFIAHSLDCGHRIIGDENRKENGLQSIIGKTIYSGESDGTDNAIIADPNSGIRCKGRMHKTKPETTERHISSRNARFNEGGTWKYFPTQPPLCGRNDGIPNRIHRIKGLGNAWVPQIALQIFKAIQEYETNTH